MDKPVRTSMKTALLSCRLTLPDGFRGEDILAFHGRDSQQLAERVEAQSLHKGLVWHVHPACLRIDFHRGHAHAELHVDGPAQSTDAHHFDAMVRRMLGLDQPIAAFEQAFRRHRQIGALIRHNPGLRVPLSSNPFEAVTWAILGQLISVSAATAIRRKLILAAGMPHSSGLWCYPDARGLAAMDEATLRQLGCSKTKAGALMALSELVGAGFPLEGPLDSLPELAVVRERLLQVRGIGPWTVDYALLRGCGFLDGSLHGDVAVRRKLQILLKRPDAVTEREAQSWLAEFSPWRALVAAHLWAMPV